ncbi:hypothetical protein KKD81_00015 [Patescibacteria group bacterium]|nr:hypothetical protein [Patescibacteria group bacterium]MBU2159077.1 hypothetical protein [Patescibacteria group bacterium]MBU2220306.1 hypothetical protein [Patescibacteria group bacterium]
MSDISFNEENTTVRPTPIAAQQPALVKLVIRWGLAKDQKGAEMVLIGTAVIAATLAIAIPFMSGSVDRPAPQVVPMNPSVPYGG